MVTLTRDNAIAAVRKNLDEQMTNASSMFGQTTDNTDMNTLIAKTIPEAINAVCLSAPVQLLDGTAVTPTSVATSQDGVVSFSVTEKVIRLVAFKAADSDIVVTDVVPEDSAIARMQLNPYVRGTYDKPVLVQLQGDQVPYKFKYYSIHGTVSSPISRCEFVVLQEYSDNTTSYSVPADLYWPIIDQLTAMVLAIYNENDKAQYFFNKAKLA